VIGLTACEESKVSINKCEIRGSLNKPTIGIISKWADIKL
jgi:hypothetical protein